MGIVAHAREIFVHFCWGPHPSDVRASTLPPKLLQIEATRVAETAQSNAIMASGSLRHRIKSDAKEIVWSPQTNTNAYIYS